MATLQQLDPKAKVYRKYSFDYRKTRIAMTQGAAQSSPYGRDAAMDDVDRRKQLHTALDRACCQQNITQDKAERLHARLDRLLDGQPDFFSEEEPGEEAEDDEEPEDEAEQVSRNETSAKDSAHLSVAMDGGKCEQCRIQDNPVGPGIARTQQVVIDFWAKQGVPLRAA